MKTTAIYIRQSIEKKDSLSLDAQEQACIKVCENNDWSYDTYSDSGFSGKNIERPAFTNLMNDIETGKIERVIAYKMDRISRSLLDFAGLVQTFEKHDVKFMSATEQFDTSTPMGRAMVYIIMTFAQLERETIRERIRDSWFHRAKRGIWAGGKTPYGYKSKRKLLEGKMQSILTVDDTQAEYVTLAFNLYIVENMSIRAVAKEINKYGVPTNERNKWTSTTLRTILNNPIYAPATPGIFRYFNDKHCMILNNIDEFDGKHGVFLGNTFTGNGKERKLNPYEERFLIIGNHEPLVDENVWLAAKHKLANNKNTGRTGTGKTTWLAGLLKCAECGYAMKATINSAKVRYLFCRGRRDRGFDTCSNSKHLRLSKIEDLVEEKLFDHINKINLDLVENPPIKDNNEIERKLLDVDMKIKNLVSAIEQGTPPAPINRRIGQLESEREQLINDIPVQSSNINMLAIKNVLENKVKNWDKSNIAEKYSIASSIISIIKIDADNLDITFKI